MISMIVAAALSGTQPTSSVIPLKRGEPYGRARTQLLRQGWHPLETSLDMGDGTLAKHFADAAEMLKAGFVEVYDCTGTGLNYCTFVWKRAGHCIHVITRGEYAPDVGAAPIIYSVRRGRCSGDH